MATIYKYTPPCVTNSEGNMQVCTTSSQPISTLIDVQNGCTPDNISPVLSESQLWDPMMEVMVDDGGASQRAAELKQASKVDLEDGSHINIMLSKNKKMVINNYNNGVYAQLIDSKKNRRLTLDMEELEQLLDKKELIDGGTEYLKLMIFGC